MKYTQQALLRFGSAQKRGSSCVALEVDWQILTTICRSHESQHLHRCRQGLSGQTNCYQAVWPVYSIYMLAHSVGHAVSRLVGQSRRAWQWKRCRFDVGELKDSELHAASAAPLQVAVAVPIETNRPSMIGCRTRGQRPQCSQGCPDSSSVGPVGQLQGLRCLVQRTSSTP